MDDCIHVGGRVKIIPPDVISIKNPLLRIFICDVFDVISFNVTSQAATPKKFPLLSCIALAIVTIQKYVLESW